MTQYCTKEKLEKGDYNIYKNAYSASTSKGVVLTIFFKWTGSVFKLIYHDLFVFVICYAFLSIFYRNVLYYNDYNRKCFELICFYMNGFSKLIPIAFLTGFYVTQVVKRWWDQFMTLPWPDKLALKLVNFVPGAVSLKPNNQA